jgi:histone-lysine N-methyltransferase SETD8
VQATRAFKKGEFVVEYAGELIDIGSAKDREAQYSLDTSKGCYMYYFTHREKQYW